MSPLEQQTVAKIDADHRPHGRRRDRRCILDGQPWPCNRAQLAADIRAGIRDHAGMMR